MEWSQPKVEGSPPSPRLRHSSTLIGRHSMLIFGGAIESCGYTNDIYILDIDALKWMGPIECRGDVPPPRASHSALLFGKSLVIVGGHTISGPATDIYVLHLDNMQWQRHVEEDRDTTAANASCGFGGGVALVGGRKIVSCGGSLQGQPLRDIFMRDIEAVVMPPCTLERDALGVGGEMWEHLWLDMANADVQIMANDVLLPAHKAVLSARSQHFGNIFRSQMAEASADQLRIPEPRDVVVALLKYFYLGEVCQDPITAIHLMHLSEMYLLPRLRILCFVVVIKGLYSSPSLLSLSDSDLSLKLFQHASTYPPLALAHGMEDWSLRFAIMESILLKETSLV